MRGMRGAGRAGEGIGVGEGGACVSDAGCAEQRGAYQGTLRERCREAEKEVINAGGDADR